MNDTERLRRELRAAREELIRKRSTHTDETGPSASCLPLMPDRDEQFRRLALMNTEELEGHIDRLERDLEDLKHGIDRPLE